MLAARMLPVIAAGIWSETFGLVFTFVIVMPALTAGLILVAMVSGKGDKEADEELRGRWGRKRDKPKS